MGSMLAPDCARHCRAWHCMTQPWVAEKENAASPRLAAGKAQARGARACTGGWSELAAEGELDAFLVMAIRRLRAERHGQADDQRTDRRLPVQRDAGRRTQRAGVEALVIPIDVADVGEQ